MNNNKSQPLYEKIRHNMIQDAYNNMNKPLFSHPPLPEPPPPDPVILFIQEVRNRTQISHGASGGNKLTHIAHWFEVCAIEHESGIKR